MFKVNPEEKQNIAEVIKKLNPVTELEARFGLEIRNFGYQKNRISKSFY